MLREQEKENILSKIKVKCECSHVLYFPAYAPDIQICNHCGKKVYRNNQAKFKDILSSVSRKQKVMKSEKV